MTKRTKAEWLELIERQQTSGLSAAEFCRRNGLDAKYFSLRRRELTNSKPAFVAVPPAAPTQLNTQTVIVRVTELTVPLADLKSTLAALAS